MKLIDTSAAIGLLRGEEKVENALEDAGEIFCTCFPVEYELFRGTRLARRTKEGEKQVEALLEEMEKLEATRESAKKVAELRVKYPEVNDFDLMIAGICISHKASLVSKDSDFQRIKELETEIISSN